jgi:Divergent InlB B-repeat domain
MRVKRLLLLAIFLPLISFIIPANSAQAEGRLYVYNQGTGSGTIYADGINCGTDCTEYYNFWEGWAHTVTYSVSADSFFAGWSGDCTGTGSCTSDTWYGDQHITATFYKYNYTISATSGSGGSISPTGPVSIPYDSSQTFSITPDTGYAINDVTIDDVSYGPISSHTFNNVKDDHTIHATFYANGSTISASKEGNGTISPAGDTLVDYNGTQSYIITPTNPGYHVYDVLIDGASVGAVTTYDFTGVTVDHTIHAIFSPDLFPITASAGTTATPGSFDGCNNGVGGSINPLGVTQVPYSGSQSYTGSIHSGYHLDQIYVDGTGIGTMGEGGSYTFENVTASHTITACFLLNEYTITLDAGANGAISGPSTVSHGDDPVYTITADTGYHIVEVKLDGSVVASGEGSPFTYNSLDDVSGDHTISATFAIDTFDFTITQGSNGSISPASATVPYGGSQSFTITPDTGYHIDTVTVDGNPVIPAPSSYTFSNVTGTHSIAATFAINTYTISVNSPGTGSGGTITPPGGTGTVILDHGSDQTFIIAPDGTHEIVDVVVDGISQGAISTYTFTNITDIHSISATFATTSHLITAIQNSNGAISPASAVVGDEGSYIFTIEPDADYYIVDVEVDLDAGGPITPVSVGPVSSYEFTNVTDDATIEATYANGYIIQTSQTGTGNIAVSPDTMDAHGRVILSAAGTDDPSFTFTGTGGAFVTDVLLDGVSQGPVPTLDLFNVNADMTLEVIFGTGWTITVNPVNNGSISPGTEEIIPGTTPFYIVSPAGGYRIADVLMDGSSVMASCVDYPTTPDENDCQYTFDPVLANHTLYATFLPGYVISATAGANGSITPAGDIDVPSGGSQTFTFAAASGYKIQDVTVDTVSQGDISNYTFTGVSTNHSITVTFTPDTYTISASKGGNGLISDPGDTVVTYQHSKTYDITPTMPGYHVDEITVDGSSILGTCEDVPTSSFCIDNEDGSYSYEFANVDTNHTIHAVFMPDLFDITGTVRITTTPHDNGGTEAECLSGVAGGGSINPAGVTQVPYGGSQTYTGSITTGYHLDQIYVDSVGIGTIEADGSYTFSNVSESHSIVACFLLNKYTISASAEIGGMISDPGDTEVSHGDSKSYTITADEGYTINQVIVNGSVDAKAPSNPYTKNFTDISGDINISVTFSPIMYTIAAAYNPFGGYLYPNGFNQYMHGSSQTYQITEQSGYHIEWIKVDNVEQQIATSYTFSNITGDHYLHVAFAEGNIITSTPGPNGSIDPAGDVEVANGDNQTFNFTPDPNYHVLDVVVDGISQGPLDSYTFTDVRARHTLSVTFINTFDIAVSSEGDGTISPSGSPVDVIAGDDQTFTFSATNPGKAVTAVLVDGVLVGSPASYTFSSVDADHSLHVIFGTEYTIHAAAVDNGSIITDGTIDSYAKVTVAPGASQSFTIKPDTGYSVADVVVDFASIGPVTGYQFDNIQSDHWIVATFSQNAYIISASAAATGGNISPLGSVLVDGGDVQQFDLTLESGYAFGPVTGTCGGTLNTMAQTFTSNPVSQDCSVEATFVPDANHHSVTSSAGAGGAISPLGAQNVADGGVTTFSLAPDSGFVIGPVTGTCGGNLNTMTQTFTTFAVTEACTVIASFVAEADDYTVISSAGMGGNIFLEGIQDVAEGEVLTFALLPAGGYAIGPVTGTCGGSVNTQSKLFTTNPITADCTVVANFVTDDVPADRHTVTSSAGTGGRITPLGDQSVADGGIITYVLQPDPGYAYGPVGGTCGGTLNTISKTFTSNTINQDCTVAASFVISTGNTHAVTTAVVGNGSLAPAEYPTAAEGGVVSFNLFPDPGNAIQSVVSDCGGRLDRLTNSFTTDALFGDCTVTAYFTSDTPATRHNVTSSADQGGNIHLIGTQEVAHSGVLTFAILPLDGYAMGPISGTCGGHLNSQTKLFTTNPVTQDCTVTASFVADGGTRYTVTSLADTGGSISPEGEQAVAAGSVVTYSLQPDTGYVMGPVNGTCGGTLDTAARTFTVFAVSQDCTVEATFAAKGGTEFIVTSSAGTGGSILPDGPQSVAEGGVITFSLLPGSEFAIGPVNGDCPGTLDTQAKTFTTDAITATCTVEATFVEADTGTSYYEITTTVVGQGDIAPTEYPAVAEGGVITFSLHPAPHYSVTSVSGCNGTRNGKRYLTGPVNSDCTVVASFVNNAYELAVNKTGSGADHAAISCDQTPDLSCVGNVCSGSYAGTVTLTATPKDGAELLGWTGCTTVTGNECTVEMNGTQNVSAEFYYFPWPMFMPAITGAGH